MDARVESAHQKHQLKAPSENPWLKSKAEHHTSRVRNIICEKRVQTHCPGAYDGNRETSSQIPGQKNKHRRLKSRGKCKSQKKDDRQGKRGKR